jgi:Flp pilus assembly protein CpaB
VRIAAAETVRLLRPGDRVDVVAAGTGAGGTEDARAGGATSVVARGARVAEVPGTAAAAGEGGSLVVLSVPRATAARLVGAGTLARLAVILW